MSRIPGGRASHGDVAAAMKKGKGNPFGGKQAKPFGKKGPLKPNPEEKGEPKMSKKAMKKEEMAEGE